MHLGIVLVFQHTKALLFYSYVGYLRGMQSASNPDMQVAIEYILQRDKAQAANRPTSNSTAASGYML